MAVTTGDPASIPIGPPPSFPNPPPEAISPPRLWLTPRRGTPGPERERRPTQHLRKRMFSRCLREHVGIEDVPLHGSSPRQPRVPGYDSRAVSDMRQNACTERGAQ